MQRDYKRWLSWESTLLLTIGRKQQCSASARFRGIEETGKAQVDAMAGKALGQTHLGPVNFWGQPFDLNNASFWFGQVSLPSDQNWATKQVRSIFDFPCKSAHMNTNSDCPNIKVYVGKFIIRLLKPF